jgi:hypothetical protein
LKNSLKLLNLKNYYISTLWATEEYVACCSREEGNGVHCLRRGFRS